MTPNEAYLLCNPGETQCASPYDQWQQLADAIVEQAVKDYSKALKGKGRNNKAAECIKAECERFFRSEWFTTLSPLDSETIIHRLSTGCVQRREGT